MTEKTPYRLADIINQMNKRIEDGLLGSFTTQVAPTAPPPPLDIRALLKMWEDMAREYKRNSITIAVLDGHIGPLTITEHPTDGRTVECSYQQAKEINQLFPLRLVRVVATDRAEFEMAMAMHGMFCPLIPPPYEMPVEQMPQAT